MKSCFPECKPAPRQRRWLLSGGFLLALTACGSSTPELPAVSTAGPSGQYEITVVHSLAAERHWEVVASGKSLTANHRKRTLRPGCTDSWDEGCWQLAETTRPLSESQMRQLIRWSVELAQSGDALPALPAPGSSHLQLLVRQAGHTSQHVIVPGDDISQQPAAAQLLEWLQSSLPKAQAPPDGLEF